SRWFVKPWTDSLDRTEPRVCGRAGVIIEAAQSSLGSGGRTYIRTGEHHSGCARREGAGPTGRVWSIFGGGCCGGSGAQQGSHHLAEVKIKWSSVSRIK